MHPLPPGSPSLQMRGTLLLLSGWLGRALKTWPQQVFGGQFSEQLMDVEKTCNLKNLSVLCVIKSLPVLHFTVIG